MEGAVNFGYEGGREGVEGLWAVEGDCGVEGVSFVDFSWNNEDLGSTAIYASVYMYIRVCGIDSMYIL